MMSENYNDFVRVFLDNGLYRRTVCYMASKIMDVKSDICGYSHYHNSRANRDANYINWLAEVLETQDDEDYIYTTKYARGVNPSVIMAVITEIEDALGKLSSDKDRERYIYNILRDLYEGYNAVEELYAPTYKKLRYCIGNCLDGENEDNESVDRLVIFANIAYGAYARFIDNLFAICLKYGINLEYLQDKYELRIMYEWSESSVIETIGGEKTYKILCAELEHPLRRDRRLTKSRLSNIWKQIEGKYIQGSESVFIQMYSDTTFESQPKRLLEWIAKSTKNNGIAKGALFEFLDLLGKTEKEIQKAFEIYFGIEWKGSYKRDKNSQHYDKLKEIFLREE